MLWVRDGLGLVDWSWVIGWRVPLRGSGPFFLFVSGQLWRGSFTQGYSLPQKLWTWALETMNPNKHFLIIDCTHWCLVDWWTQGLLEGKQLFSHVPVESHAISKLELHLSMILLHKIPIETTMLALDSPPKESLNIICFLNNLIGLKIWMFHGNNM